MSDEAATLLTPKLRRLAKARRQELEHLGVHLRAKHHLRRLGPSTPFTVYAFTIEDPRSRRQHQQRQPAWVLEKRFSDFYELRLRLLGHVQLWERARRKQRAFALLADVLRRPLALGLPRRHFRCDSEAIVRERCAGLYAFVRCLLAVYADVYAHLFDEKAASSAYEALWGIYDDIAAFLNVPACRREAENRHAAAVLALEDCGAVAACSREDDYACCICFDDGDDTWDEDDVRSSSGGGEPNERKQGVVRLPCGHEFHEDCILPWLGANATCPLCRQAMAPP